MKKLQFLTVLSIFLFSFGCSSVAEVASGPGGSGSASGAKPTGQFAPSENPTADIEKLGDRFAAIRSFKAKMNADVKPPLQADMEYQAPDRYRFKTSNTMEMIIIGPVTYIKFGDTWRMMNLPADPNLANMRQAFTKDTIKWYSNVKYAGEESVDGRAAYVYTYQNKGPNSQGENDSKLWMDAATGLPVKIEAVYKTGPMKQMTVSYDYDDAVSIEKPTGAIPAKPGQN